MIDNIKVIAADIDLTLTFKGAGLPERTKEAFEILHKQGVKIGLATGRVIEQREKDMGKNWGLSFEFDFVIGMNGGMIYNRETDSTWSVPMLSTDEMRHILVAMMPLVEEHKISVNVEGGGNHSAMYIQKDLIESAERHGFIFEDKTGDVDGFCYTPAYKFLFRGQPEQDQLIRDYFAEKIGDEYQIVGTFPGTLEVMHKGIDKGNGLKKYCEMMNIDIKDTIAFGDSENDNTLLDDAGWGVCLCDGRDGTKAHADALTDYGCDEGGVGHYLFDYYINK